MTDEELRIKCMEWALRIFERSEARIKLSPTELAQILFEYVRSGKQLRQCLYLNRHHYPEAAGATPE